MALPKTVLVSLSRLVEEAFNQHWRHDGGWSMISLEEFDAHSHGRESYIRENTLYHSDGELAWSLDLDLLA